MLPRELPDHSVLVPVEAADGHGGFVLAVGMFLGLYFLGSDIVAFEVAVLSMDWTVLIVTGVLLAVVFRRAGRRASSRLAGGTAG